MQSRRHSFVAAVFIISILAISNVLILENVDSDSQEGDQMNGSGNIVPDGVSFIHNFTGLPHHSTAFNGPRDYILEDGDNVYFAYTWMNQSKMTLTMVASYDNGENWTSPLDIWKDMTSFQYENLPHMGLYKWKGQIILLFLTGHIDRTYRQLLFIKVPITDWKALANSTVNVIRNYEGSNWDLTFDDNYMYLSEIRSGEWQGFYRIYDNVTWSTPTTMNSGGSTMRVAIETIKTLNGTRILYFYCRPYVAGYASGNVHLRTSDDGGNSWSSLKTVMDNSDDYSMIVCEKVDNKLLLFASRLTEDEIELVSSSDGGNSWTPESTLISNRGLNDLDQAADTDFSIGYRDNGSTILLAYEGENNIIKMIHSNDSGSTWSLESDAVLLRGNDSYGVCLSTNSNFFSCVVDFGNTLDNIFLYDMRDLQIGNRSNVSPMIMNNDILTTTVNSSYSVRYYVSDSDTPLGDLVWSMRSNASWLQFDQNHTLNGTPLDQDVGTYWVNITVSDGTSSDSTNFTLRVRKIYSNQHEYPPLNINMAEDQEGFILDIDTFLNEQSDHRIVEAHGSDNIQLEITDDGDIALKPKLNWAGKETISVVFEKDGIQIERTITISIVNENDPPEIGSIEIPRMDIFEGESYLLEAITDDPDILYGDSLVFTWYVDGIEYTDQGSTMRLDLPSGDHSITVVVTDLKGATSTKSANIEVLPLDKENDDSFRWILIISITLVISVVLIITGILVFSMIIRKRNLSEVRDDKEHLSSMPHDPSYVHSGQIETSPDRPQGFNSNISDLYGEVVEGRAVEYDDELILKDLNKMKNDDGISRETYDMIRNRMNQTS